MVRLHPLAPRMSTTSTSTTTQAAPSTSSSFQLTSLSRINPLETEEDRKINAIIIFSATVADHLIPNVDTFEDDPVKL